MTTITDTHAATVTAMYEAFGRGDVPAVLSQLSEDVTRDVAEEPWTPHAAGIPWLAPRRGPDEDGAVVALRRMLDTAANIAAASA